MKRFLLSILLTAISFGQGQVFPPAGGGAPSGSAGGDLSGTYPNPTVAKVNGVTPASTNTASAVVVRDGSGNFSAGTITANLTGNASGSAATVTDTKYPAWSKYTTTKIANGVGGCVNANGCWSVNGGAAVNAAAGLTQDIVLVQLAARGVVTSYRIKTATACAGATTILTGFGTASTNTFYLAQTYDLKTAVGNTNISPSLPVNMGSDTAAAVNLVASLVTTVENIDQINDGCSFDTWVLSSVLP